MLLAIFVLSITLAPASTQAGSRKVLIDFGKGSLKSSYIRVVSAADGVPEIVAANNRKYLSIDATKTKVSADGMGLLYFDINDKLLFNTNAHYLLYVKYSNEGFGLIRVQYDSQTSQYRLAEGCSNMATEQSGTRTAIFLLKDAKFGGRQNSQADFRLSLNKNTKIAKVQLVSAGKYPEKAFGKIIEHNRPKTPVGKDFDVCFGGIDGAKLTDLDGIINTLNAKLSLFTELGVTSKETYVRWNLIEYKKGRYDFSFYDKQLALQDRWGIKWVPFIIIGPAYSLPDWFYKSKDRVDYVCLEHNKKCDVQSLWNPHLRKYINSFMRQFAKHYKNSGQLESILLGITGNYGESIYVATPSNDWTADAHGKYHTHAGFWCGDKYARKSWHKWLMQKYPTIEALNEAWGSKFEYYEQINPDQTVKGRQWLDLVEWYRGCMTDWAEFWISTTRKYFPSTEINLCTGGDMRVVHGLDLSAQAKMCAKYNAGIRITNEASDYRLNYQLTRLCASACRFYGIKFGFEPAGTCTPTAGVAARMYNATASGCNHVHFYENIITNQTASIQTWVTNAQHMKHRNPKTECALLYPFTSQTQASWGFPHGIKTIRDMIDVNWIDERMVLDGALGQNRVLLIDQGRVFPAKVLKKIEEWILGGGTLITQNNKKIADLSGSKAFANKYLVGDNIKTLSPHTYGKGRVILVPNAIASVETANVLAGKTKIQGFEPLDCIEIDIASSIRDSVFVTYFEDCALVLNFNNKAVTKKFVVDGKPKEFTLEPYSITEIPRKPKAKN